MNDDRVREILREELSRPNFLPAPFRTFVGSWASLAAEIPRSQLIGLYTTADTISGLGEPSHGRPCTLRVSASPYHFLQMTFDEVYGKWISSQVWFSQQIGSIAKSNATWNDVSSQEFPYFFIPGFKALYDSGVRPQVYVTSRMITNVTKTTSCRAALGEINDGDAVGGSSSPIASKIADGGQIDETTGTNYHQQMSGWSTMTFASAPTEEHAYIWLQKQGDENIGTAYHETSIVIRLVADDVST